MRHHFGYSRSLIFRLVILITGLLSITPTLIFAQEPQCSEQFTPDNVTILRGKLNVLLSKGSFKVIDKKKMLREYPKDFEFKKVIDVKGYSIGENATLRFYQTDITNLNKNDMGLSAWKMFQSFTERISDGHWTESGRKRLGSDYLYYLRVKRLKKIEVFEEFVFFYIHHKLVIAIFQCPLDDYYLWQPFFFGNNLGPCHLMVIEKHRPRFLGTTTESMKF